MVTNIQFHSASLQERALRLLRASLCIAWLVCVDSRLMARDLFAMSLEELMMVTVEIAARQSEPLQQLPHNLMPDADRNSLGELHLTSNPVNLGNDEWDLILFRPNRHGQAGGRKSKHHRLFGQVVVGIRCERGVASILIAADCYSWAFCSIETPSLYSSAKPTER